MCVLCVCVCVCARARVRARAGVCARGVVCALVCVQRIYMQLSQSGATYMLCRVCTRAGTRIPYIYIDAGIWGATIYIARKLCRESRRAACKNE